jgi:hypothetical protein
MDDLALIDALGRVANARIVITKQERRKHTTPSWQALQQICNSQGLLVSAYPVLEELAPRAREPPSWSARERRDGPQTVFAKPSAVRNG